MAETFMTDLSKVYFVAQLLHPLNSFLYFTKLMSGVLSMLNLNGIEFWYASYFSHRQGKPFLKPYKKCILNILWYPDSNKNYICNELNQHNFNNKDCSLTLFLIISFISLKGKMIYKKHFMAIECRSIP